MKNGASSNSKTGGEEQDHTWSRTVKEEAAQQDEQHNEARQWSPGEEDVSSSEG